MDLKSKNCGISRPELGKKSFQFSETYWDIYLLIQSLFKMVMFKVLGLHRNLLYFMAFICQLSRNLHQSKPVPFVLESCLLLWVLLHPRDQRATWRNFDLDFGVRLCDKPAELQVTESFSLAEVRNTQNRGESELCWASRL